MNPLCISPPLLNSANPWCTTREQLQELYDSPHTGAVTTRTCLVDGFSHDPCVHQFAFYNPNSFSTSEPNRDQGGTNDTTGSLNTLGYSPLPLQQYLTFIQTISDGLRDLSDGTHYKPFIISVTGSAEEVVRCFKLITLRQRTVRMVLAMEVNLSCPNIPGKPPPAYSTTALFEYLVALKKEMGHQVQSQGSSCNLHGGLVHVPIGIKTPPYTYHDQFQALVNALLGSAEAEPRDLPCPVTFITATNTLGSSLLLAPTNEMASGAPHSLFHHVLQSSTGTGIGGLAGAPLHPLALGNVYTIKGMLSQNKQLEKIQIIGVGGVENVNGYNRMRAVGASAVGIGTALGRKGVTLFKEIDEAFRGHSTV